MNMTKKWLSLGLVCSLGLVGCITEDSLRERMGSSDETEARAAEQQARQIVETGRLWGCAVPVEKRLRYAQLLTDQATLLAAARTIATRGKGDYVYNREYDEDIYELHEDERKVLADLVSRIKCDRPESRQALMEMLGWVYGFDGVLKKMVGEIGNEAGWMEVVEKTKNWQDPPDEAPREYVGDRREAWQRAYRVMHREAVERVLEVSTNESVLVRLACQTETDDDRKYAGKAFDRLVGISTLTNMLELIEHKPFDAVVAKTDEAVLVEYLCTRGTDFGAFMDDRPVKVLKGVRAAENIVRIVKDSKSPSIQRAAKDELGKRAGKVDIDELLAREIEADESNWSWMAPVFKDRKRISRMACARLDRALESCQGKEEPMLVAWNRYGQYIRDDAKLVEVSTTQLPLRRKAFDRIVNPAMRTKALAAIRAGLERQLEACVAKQGKFSRLIAGMGQGDDLVAWLKGKREQTQLQNKATFEKMKGNEVVLRGEIKNVDRTPLTDRTYVALRVATVGMFRHIDVRFMVPNELKGKVSAWMKGETHVLRGRLSSMMDLVEDATCEDGEIVVDEIYDEVLKIKEVLSGLKYQIKEIDEKKVPPVGTGPSAFGTAVKSAAEWLKRGVDDVKTSGDDVGQSLQMLNGILQ